MISFISAIIAFVLLLSPFILVALLVWAIVYASNKSNVQQNYNRTYTMSSNKINEWDYIRKQIIDDTLFNNQENTRKQYYNTTYYLFTRNEYNDVVQDRGLFGEYDIFMQLRWYENYGGRFLYNVYLPKKDGTTTEIDIVFLTPKGIFVIESKNYRGWIFGREDYLYWTQTFNKNAKERFYNPIKQNETHIKYIKQYIKAEIPVYSVIVFSDECNLTKVPPPKGNTIIINRRDVNAAIKYVLDKNRDFITYRQLDEIQKELFPYSQRTKKEKEKHIEDIKNKYKK